MNEIKYNTFEEYLEYQFCDQYTGTKDGYEDAIDRWYASLDTDEIIAYADEYVKKAYKAGMADGLARASEILADK